MSVNDLVVCGARPVQFLDYIACGRIDEDAHARHHEGHRARLRAGRLQPRRRETAEMPDVYGPDDFDLAGFAVGAGREGGLSPAQGASVRKATSCLASPSSGIHSNGLSLARKVIPPSDKAWEELLTPTRIYTREMKTLSATRKVLAAAHITGGGLYGNLQRVIPEGLGRASASTGPCRRSSAAYSPSAA